MSELTAIDYVLSALYILGCTLLFLHFYLSRGLEAALLVGFIGCFIPFWGIILHYSKKE